VKKKTKDKLERKWQNLPLHHIDACIVLEVLMENEKYETCENYLNRVGHKYRGNISISALGEIFMTLFKKFDEEGVRQELFLFISRLIDKRKISFSSPRLKTYDIVKKIMRVETRAERMDSLNLANATTENADVFVTLDSTFVGNKKLESALKIKIKHPNEL